MQEIPIRQKIERSLIQLSPTSLAMVASFVEFVAEQQSLEQPTHEMSSYENRLDWLERLRQDRDRIQQRASSQSVIALRQEERY